MDLYLKSFLLGKDGENDGRQDALACNIDARLFAIADGVSNSYHPEIVAQALCEIFVNEDPSILGSWEDFSEEHLLPAIKDRWERKIKAYLDSLTSRMLRHELFNFETWKIGASTFCGIYIDETNNLLRYVIIGDSTLFIIDTDGSVQEINSSPKFTSENGEELTDYSNSTSAVLSNDSISGEWLIGSISIENVTAISMMTDGMAKWFQKELVDGKNPNSILWRITDSEEFKDLADTARVKGDMDDDLAVILINFTPVELWAPKVTKENEENNSAEDNLGNPFVSTLDSNEDIESPIEPLSTPNSESKNKEIEKPIMSDDSVVDKTVSDTIGKGPIADRADSFGDKEISHEKEQHYEANVTSINSSDTSFNDLSETEEPSDGGIAEAEEETQSEGNEHPADKQIHKKEYKNSFIEKIKATMKIWRNNHTD